MNNDKFIIFQSLLCQVFYLAYSGDWTPYSMFKQLKEPISGILVCYFLTNFRKCRTFRLVSCCENLWYKTHCVFKSHTLLFPETCIAHSYTKKCTGSSIVQWLSKNIQTILQNIHSNKTYLYTYLKNWPWQNYLDYFIQSVLYTIHVTKDRDIRSIRRK